MTGWGRLIGLPLLPVAIVFSPASAAELATTLRLIPQYHHSDDASPFSIPSAQSPFPEKSSRQEIELRYRRDNLHLLATFRNRIIARRKPENELLANELYVNFSPAGQDITLGKKIVSWGVGFGFRPLDVLQRENRRRLYLNTLEGVPALIWETFGARSAVTAVYANPGGGKDNDAIDEESVALKYYRLQGDTDLHGVARWSEKNRLELGVGFTRVISDDVEWHGSLLFQQRYERLLHRLATVPGSTLATANPVESGLLDNGGKALLGFTWSLPGGWSTLVEAWYDDSAPTKNQWRAVEDLTRRQRTLLDDPRFPAAAVFGNIAWSSQLFSAANLLRQNLLIRLAYDGGTLDTALDVLTTPGDNGWVVTAGTEYAGDRQRINLALRYFGGSAHAAYRLLPETLVLLAGWQISF